MRTRKTSKGLTINAIAGTHVVVLGLDLSDEKRKKCLGFAIQREDVTEGEKYWMSGMKTFEATDPLLGPGGQVSSHDHPFQSFQWADYTAKPEHDYTYTVIPLYGTPAKLRDGDAVSVKVTTESEWGKKHSVFFNRGAVATQEYARRFQNIPPDKLKGDSQKAAYLWLSRGLLAAFKEFVGRAEDSTFGLRGAFYEFQWPEALQALKAASDAGADVVIIYDAIPSATGPKTKNETAIQDADIEGLCTPCTNGTIMHNKFLVLTKNDVPIAVWTGSTNLTENGIFGHSNCGHAIEDKKIAATYLDYWKRLKEDAENADEKTWVAENNPNPPDPWTADNTVVFSPRTGLKPLTWYEEIVGRAKEAEGEKYWMNGMKTFETTDPLLVQGGQLPDISTNHLSISMPGRSRLLASTPRL